MCHARLYSVPRRYLGTVRAAARCIYSHLFLAILFFFSSSTSTPPSTQSYIMSIHVLRPFLFTRTQIADDMAASTISYCRCPSCASRSRFFKQTKQELMVRDLRSSSSHHCDGPGVRYPAKDKPCFAGGFGRKERRRR